MDTYDAAVRARIATTPRPTGTRSQMRIDLSELAASGISAEEISAAADDVSKQILENTIKREYVDSSGALHLIIG